MKIIGLKAENIKRLKAIDITPDGTLQIIAGRNSQGKSSVMDAIWLALGGGSASKAIDEPVRRGEDHAEVRLDLGDLVVTRTWKSGKSELKVEAPSGARFASPQDMLNNLLGKFSFDPLAFIRLTPKDQVTELLKLVDLPINLEALTVQRKALYEERTEAGREVKRLEALVATYPKPESSLPEEEVSVTDLLAEVREAESFHRNYIGVLARRDELVGLVADFEQKVVDTKERLRMQENVLAAIEPILPDLATMQDKLANAESTNTKIRDAKQVTKTALELINADLAHSGLGAKIDALDKTKADALAQAIMPVPGMTFTEDGVQYNGIPFDQASSSEQIRVSLGMAMAVNPEMKVVRIMDGSLLDEDSLNQIYGMALESGFQVFVEMVGNPGGTAIVIEDGEVLK